MARYAGYVRRLRANTWSRKGIVTDDIEDAVRASLTFARGVPGWESAVVEFADEADAHGSLTAAELVALGGKLIDRTETDSEHIAKHAKARLQHDAKPTGPARPSADTIERQTAAIQATIAAHAHP